jgi:hypothetical protein
MLINKENIDLATLPSQLENFAELRAKALSYIQQSSNATWTDHNIHDPGITILEAICYALSDVGFRMNFPIQDLLANNIGKPTTNAYYSAAQILPNRACTIADYRKLLIDINTVKNAWLLPIVAESQGFNKDYEPMYVYEAESRLILKHELDTLPITAAHKAEILAKSIFLQGIYALNIQFEPQPILGNIDSGESFEPVYKTKYFGDIYMDIANWKELVNNKLALNTIANTAITNLAIVIHYSNKNKFNNNDGKLDERILSQWYYHLEIQVNNKLVFLLSDVLFECYFESKKGILGKDLKEILTENNFLFFKNMFEKIKLLNQAYIEIEAVLHKNRNLCEDFLPQISAIPTVEFRICADIDAHPTVDLEQLQAEIYYKIEQYLAPSVPFYSFAELQAKGMAIEEILEGPLLKHGFIIDADMGPNYFENTNIYLSDLINAIYEIEGLVNVRNVQLSLVNEAGNPIANSNNWEIAVPPGSQPVLNKRKSKLTFFKNQLPLTAHFKESIVKYNFLNINALKVTNSAVPELATKGSYRGLALHYTLADEFPATYKIGKNLPDAFLNDAKYFTSKQLEGYLLHFDQIIANFLLDLDQLRQTLSWNTIAHTAFNSPSPEWRRSYLIDKQVDVPWQNVVEAQDAFLKKRNQSLDFLLSRFAENLQELDNHFYLTVDNLNIDKTLYYNELIALKQKFLGNYVALSANRGGAINTKENASYLASSPAGYEQRIAGFLGCELQKNGLRKTLANLDAGLVERGYFHCLEHTMLRIPALSSSMQQILTTNGLLPNLLSICTADDCTACGGHDPYSFTASIALPGWLPIYADIHYRDYMEQLIRRETPVGCMLRICWIDKETMSQYEMALEKWWNARSAFANSTLIDFLSNFETLVLEQNKLILALKAMRTVYPEATLHGCEDEGEVENNTRIFLGKTHLGAPDI